jgi:hypothetical protein
MSNCELTVLHKIPKVFNGGCQEGTAQTSDTIRTHHWIMTMHQPKHLSLSGSQWVTMESGFLYKGL